MSSVTSRARSRRARRAIARATTSRGPELGHRVLVGHEAAPAGVAQDRALAAHGLADQRQGAVAEREGGGVELDQLQVGQGGAGAGRQGGAVGGGAERVGGERRRAGPAPPAARTTARAHRVISLAPSAVRGAQAAGAAVAHDHLQGALALGDSITRGRRAGRAASAATMCAPGRVAAGVDHARGRVGALARQAQPAAASRSNTHAPGAAGSRPGPGPPRQMPGDRLDVAEAGAGARACRRGAPRPCRRRRPPRRSRPGRGGCCPRRGRPSSRAPRARSRRRRGRGARPRCRCRPRSRGPCRVRRTNLLSP